ncbi:protein-L-isoaspartate O-methyltransferase family protein [Piscinibacter sp.]|uniref:protein-L-isoaspartate O-methyltransferase family protein n=1 Tax=Piscinibacter sp. TaxID=1903157 RepID=UPI002BE9332A|nr:rRNA adenine N-6-methyltransferase family protein [Albitalea sp.]HUG21645.1 rRNA adenine N-6-methyltransferase family protein [Albitalea sp.]
MPSADRGSGRSLHVPIWAGPHRARGSLTSWARCHATSTFRPNFGRTPPTRPLPIGFGKSISLPFIVAVMTDLLDVRPSDSMLEIGTGLGYQAAILVELPQRVLSVELIAQLAERARRRLVQQKHANVQVMVGNGGHGWPDQGSLALRFSLLEDTEPDRAARSRHRWGLCKVSRKRIRL